MRNMSKCGVSKSCREKIDDTEKYGRINGLPVTMGANVVLKRTESVSAMLVVFSASNAPDSTKI